ncbi:MAG TPA: DUF2267 domain-containing protein [Kofleriaceae bacterium]|jgi:uncharacterized protein (DUF2267 family)|nr:DUF2267 domain-containing protein [Kofleriaceae bacterium]
MRTASIVSHVAGHAGVSHDRAERATRAVLSGLGAYLTPAYRQLVADELPAPLGAALLDNTGVAVPIEERVLGPGVTAGRAYELVASVCRVLAEELSTRALLALRAAVPIGIASLLATPSPELAGTPPDRRRYETLAGGRPGSRHPISDAPPTRWQTGSVSATNPHAETKLSSTPGTTQERRRETFASGRPGSTRSLAGRRR